MFDGDEEKPQRVALVPAGGGREAVGRVEERQRRDSERTRKGSGKAVKGRGKAVKRQRKGRGEKAVDGQRAGSQRAGSVTPCLDVQVQLDCVARAWRVLAKVRTRHIERAGSRVRAVVNEHGGQGRRREGDEKAVGDYGETNERLEHRHPRANVLRIPVLQPPLEPARPRQCFSHSRRSGTHKTKAVL